MCSKGEDKQVFCAINVAGLLKKHRFFKVKLRSVLVNKRRLSLQNGIWCNTLRFTWKPEFHSLTSRTCSTSFGHPVELHFFCSTVGDSI